MSTNQAIICIICNSSLLPVGFFLSSWERSRSAQISAAAAAIKRGTLMKQSSSPSAVKEPQDQLMSSPTAEVTPPSSVLMLWNDTVCFIIRPFAVKQHNEYRNYSPESLSSFQGNGWGDGFMLPEPKGIRQFHSHKRCKLGSVNLKSRVYWTEAECVVIECKEAAFYWGSLHSVRFKVKLQIEQRIHVILCASFATRSYNRFYCGKHFPLQLNASSVWCSGPPAWDLII